MNKVKFFMAMLALTVAAPAFAQGFGEADTQSIVIAALVGVMALAAIGHMIYVLFIRKKFRTDWTAEEFVEMRKAAGLPEKMSGDEYEDIDTKLNALVDTWDYFTDEDGEECILPLHLKNVKASIAVCTEVTAMMPTDADLVSRLNNLGEVTNEMRKRVFAASKTMLVITAIAALLLGWAGDAWGPAIAWGVIVGALYSMSCMKPQYSLIRKELEGKDNSSFLTGIIAGMLGGVAAAPTYRTVTKWSDGSTTTDDDNSSFWVRLVLMIIAVVFLVFVLPIISFWNYLRNYCFS